MEDQPSLVGPLRMLGIGVALIVVGLVLWWLAAITLPGPLDAEGEGAVLVIGVLLLILLVGVGVLVSALVWLAANLVRRRF